jgi:diphthine-ammonia ligase
LFSHRLSFTKTKVIVTDPEPYPVAYLQVEDAELVEKEGWVRPSIDGLRETLGLKGSTDGLDEQGREVLEELGAVQRRPNKKILEQFADLCIRKDEPEEILRFAKRGRWFVASINGRTKAGETVGEELRHCFDTISSR